MKITRKKNNSAIKKEIEKPE
ncbi:hypothetical protein QUA46_25535 [Microcoleus sp. MON2_D6]